MSKPWKPAKKSVELRAEVRPSRIRRDPPHAAAADRKAYWRSAEWDRKFAIAGIGLFAVAIFIVTVGFSAITGQREVGAPPPNVEQFGSCEGGPNCVIDGDTIRVGGETVKIAGIEVPAIQSAGCPDEQHVGVRAVALLTQLLNSGKVTLGGTVREADGQLGAKVEVNGRDVARAMISAGLARTNDGTKQGWCA